VRNPDFAPANPATALPHLGTYRRRLPVSLERLYENAIDWEHLPHLHASSFAAIDCLDSGPWGFRARVESSAGEQSTIELELDRASRRWITRTLDGRSAGSEIWTHAFPIEPRRTDIVVDFFAPNVETAARARVGAAFVALYTRLYDEDVAMMVERERKLDRRIDSESGALTLAIGRLGDLALPLDVRFRGRDYVVARAIGRTATGGAPDAELVAYTKQCPHRLGPLPRQPDERGEVRCPWHGYRFDVRSGACVSGAPCRLAPAPRVEVDADGRVRLVAFTIPTRR
jgi:nitrite reductase/ring-hydroxylating ferredoxin subunit